MRGNNKKGRKITKKEVPNRPEHDYMSPQYNYNEYGEETYYNRPSPSRPKTTQSAQQKPEPKRVAPKRTAHKKVTRTKTRTTSERPDTTRTARRKVKKKKTKFFIGRIFFLIGFIIGVIYLISIVLETSQKPVISYQMVQRGIIDNSEVFNGLIVRDEMVIPNAQEGNMYLIAAEGDKVKKNGEIYQILDSSQTSLSEFEGLENDIADIESDIEKMQVKRQNISYYQNEIQEINNSIDTYVEIYYMQAKPGQLMQAHELRKQLEFEITKRKNVHMKDSTVALNELKGQKQELSSIITNSEKIYRSQAPGIVSYYTDGFEKNFTLDNLDKITLKDIKQKYTPISTTTNQIIGLNEPAYRLIKANNWKVVSFMPEAWAEKFKVGQTHEFILIDDDHNQVQFTLRVEKNTPEEKEHRVVFASNEQLDVFANKRTISFKSLQYMYEGLKIPRSAITERNLIKVPSEYIVESDNGKGVMKPAGGSAGNMFVGLNIQYNDTEGYTYVLQNFEHKGDLQLGDQIIHPTKADKPYTIAEVSTAKGVYVVNGRITKFKQINTMAQNEEYVIVTANTANGLKQFDQIVTNPKNIQEEQLLRNMDVQNNKK